MSTVYNLLLPPAYTLFWAQGLRIRIEGRENIPEGGALIASKHQSMMETQAFWQILPDPAIILKKELAYLPFFGWFAVKLGNIVVDRGAAAKALRKMLGDARRWAADGRQILIFPEGTRNTDDNTILLPFKSGIYHLADTRPGTEFVPLWIDNINRVLPKGKFLPIPLLCEVHVGTPLSLREGETKEAFLERSRNALLALAPAET